MKIKKVMKNQFFISIKDVIVIIVKLKNFRIFFFLLYIILI